MGGQSRDLRHEVLRFVYRHVQENGYAPTCAEIRKAVGLSSKSHASYYLGVLEREGHIQRTPRSPRGLCLLGGADELLSQPTFDAWSRSGIHGTSRHAGLSEREPVFVEAPLPGKGKDYDG